MKEGRPMENSNECWKLYTFGMSDKNDRLITIKMPARNYPEAVVNVKRLLSLAHDLSYPGNQFWLNNEEDYE